MAHFNTGRLPTNRDPSIVVTIDGVRVIFTDLEMEYFATLFNARGAILSVKQLHRAIYGVRLSGGPNWPVVGVYIHQLRRKLADTNFRIRTHHCRGYQLTRTAFAYAKQARAA